MRYFYDCEFIEDGKTIDLVSIGIVSEDEREYYAISTEFNPNRAGSWVRDNVLNQLPSQSSPLWKNRQQIRDEVLSFVTSHDGSTELWAWFSAYDHVALCQLWGSMVDLPRSIPRYTHELRQLWAQHGKPTLPAAGTDQHSAIADARHNLKRWQVITSTQ